MNMDSKMVVEVVDVSGQYEEGLNFLVEADGIPLCLTWRNDVAEALKTALEKAGLDFGNGLPAKTKPNLAMLAAQLLAMPAPKPKEEFRGCECGDGSQVEPHPCPYAEEINGNDTPCTCCDACRRSCAMDI